LPVPPARPDPGDPLGHYAALDVPLGASFAEIRAGYRRRALATHPDKGGSAESFREVASAFDVLSDSVQRAAYDRGGRCSGAAGGAADASWDSTQEPSAAAERQHGSDATAVIDSAVAKHAYARVLLASPKSWTRILAGLGQEVLNGLESLLREAQEAVARPTATESELLALTDEVEGAEGGDAAGITQGIFRTGQFGYAVKVGWRSFYIKSGLPIWNLEQAVNLHIVLVQVRNRALGRHREFVQALLKVGCIDLPGGDDDCPPLLEAELLQALSEEPLAPLQFSSDLHRKRRRIMSPFTPSLGSALRFRGLTRRVLAQDFAPVTGPTHVTAVKRFMMAQAQQDRRTRLQFEIDMGAAVATELAVRRDLAAAASALPPGSHPAVSNGGGGGGATAAAMMPMRRRGGDLLARGRRLALQAAESDRAEVRRLRKDLRSEREDLRRAAEVGAARTAEVERLRDDLRRATAAEEAQAAEAARLQAVCRYERERAAAQQTDLEAARKAKADVDRRSERQAERLLEAQAAVLATADLERRATAREEDVRQLEAELLALQRRLVESERARDMALKARCGGAREGRGLVGVAVPRGCSIGAAEQAARHANDGAAAAVREAETKWGRCNSGGLGSKKATPQQASLAQAWRLVRGPP